MGGASATLQQHRQVYTAQQKNTGYTESEKQQLEYNPNAARAVETV